MHRGGKAFFYFFLFAPAFKRHVNFYYKYRYNMERPKGYNKMCDKISYKSTSQ